MPCYHYSAHVVRTQSQVLKLCLSRSQAVMRSPSSHTHSQGMKSRARNHRESCTMGVPSMECYTTRILGMVYIWGHMELPWQCCKMDVHFHNPPSAILLNLSHITFFASSKWQTSAKDLKRSSPASNSHIPSPVMLAKIHNSSSNEPEEPKHSEGAKKEHFLPLRWLPVRWRQ